MERYINEDHLAYENEVIKMVKEHALPLENSSDLDPLMEKIGDAKYVLLGEASHGTHEYYTWRARITKRLIVEKGFSFIGVEGDWPDCYRLNRYIKGYNEAGNNTVEVLKEFNRWPTWMWGNWEVAALSEWLLEHNKKLSAQKRVGFYGLDVYSLSESLEATLDYLVKTDPAAYEAAKKALACFEPFANEGTDYAHATKLLSASCEDEVINLLKEIRNKIEQYNTDFETVFSTEQNALVALHAENYYREMIKGGPMSWNIRDKHMVETLERLMKFHGKEAKTIVWEHNTHIGDARATEMTRVGMVNVGELITHRYHKQGVVKVGFGSYKGTVIAGKNWGDKMKVMNVPNGVKGSWEYLLHKSGHKNKLLLMEGWRDSELFKKPIEHRAIGVVYNPEFEQFGNYVPSIIPYRYDAFIFIDETKALHPLHIEPDGHQIPETYPWGV